MPIYTSLEELDPDFRRRLVDYCARRLNHFRHGTEVPFYLWANSNRREVELVLEEAAKFSAGKQRHPPAETS